MFSLKAIKQRNRESIAAKPWNNLLNGITLWPKHSDVYVITFLSRLNDVNSIPYDEHQ